MKALNFIHQIFSAEGHSGQFWETPLPPAKTFSFCTSPLSQFSSPSSPDSATSLLKPPAPSVTSFQPYGSIIDKTWQLMAITHLISQNYPSHWFTTPVYNSWPINETCWVIRDWTQRPWTYSIWRKRTHKYGIPSRRPVQYLALRKFYLRWLRKPAMIALLYHSIHWSPTTQTSYSLTMNK